MEKCNGTLYQNQLGYQSICVTDEKICLVGLDNEKVDCYMAGTTEYYNMLVKIQKLNVDKKQDEINEIVEDVVEEINKIKKYGFKLWFKGLFSKQIRQELGFNWGEFFVWWK